MEFDLLGFEGKWVVLEIGSAYTKCGFGGKYTPKHIVPSIFNAANTTLSLLCPTKGTEIEWRQALETLLREIFHTFLGIGPGYNVLVIDSLLYPLNFRKALAYVLFKRFKISNVKYCLGEATPLFTLPPTNGTETSLHSTGLILDVGFKESRILPVYEGIAMISKMKTGGAGGFVVCERLRALLQEHGRLYTPLIHGSKPKLPSPPVCSESLEDILHRCCFISLRALSPSHPPKLKFPPPGHTCYPPGQRLPSESEPKDVLKPVVSHTRRRSSTSSIMDESSKIASVQYPLGDGTSIEVNGYVQAHAADVLFETQGEVSSVASLILDCLLSCEIDMRCELINRVVLCGGVSMIPGFVIRLMEEFEELLRGNPKYRSLKAMTGKLKLIDTKYAQNTLSWTGGSLIAQLQSPAITQRLSLEVYEKTPTLPNWHNSTTVNNNE